MLYWHNPTDPKIRPDPTLKKKKDKKRPTDPKISKTCDFFLILRDGAPRKNGNSFKPEVPNSEYGGRRLLAVACRKIWCENLVGCLKCVFVCISHTCRNLNFAKNVTTLLHWAEDMKCLINSVKNSSSKKKKSLPTYPIFVQPVTPI